MKIKLRSKLIVLAFLANVHSNLAQTSLVIAPTNKQAILFWTNRNGTNGVLQSCTDLTSPNWVSVTDAVPVNFMSQAAVSVTNSSTARFFRLSLVPPTADGMAFIPAGWFRMGDTLDGNIYGDASPTNIYVSAFYMDTNLVSYSQWQAVYECATNHGYGFDDAGAGKAANHPVQTVDWYDVMEWCNARSQQAGKTPVYYTDAALTQVYTNGETDAVYVNWKVSGYRLPTEAEWEKAARGGSSGQRFPWGDAIAESQANYYGETASYTYDLGPNGYNPIGIIGGQPATSPVGSFAPNGYGIYDMAGNVSQRVWDWFDGNWYSEKASTQNDPHGPDAASGGRTVRSGSYNTSDDAYTSRCACRAQYALYNAYNQVGFRCVRASISNPVLDMTPMSFLTFSNLALGGVYQLQQFVEGYFWTNQTVNFTATNSVYSQMVSGVAGSGDYRLALSPVPAQAFAVAQVVNGFVVGATITSGGSSYLTSPAVSIASNDGGTNATGVSEISSAGVVTNIVITDAGIGYTNTPTIEIAPPPAAAVSPNVQLVMQIDSASLAPYDNYQIQFTQALGTPWQNWNGGLFTSTDVTNSQYLFVTNTTGFFRLEYVP